VAGFARPLSAIALRAALSSTMTIRGAYPSQGCVALTSPRSAAGYIARRVVP